MAFSDDTVRLRWKRAGGKCECQRSTHRHGERCNNTLIWANRGRVSVPGTWEAHHRVSFENGGSDSLSNCEILCWDCHRKTL